MQLAQDSLRTGPARHDEERRDLLAAEAVRRAREEIAQRDRREARRRDRGGRGRPPARRRDLERPTAGRRRGQPW